MSDVARPYSIFAYRLVTSLRLMYRLSLILSFFVIILGRVNLFLEDSAYGVRKTELALILERLTELKSFLVF